MPNLGGGLLGCYRCGNVWRFRKSPVRTCPRCKSVKWDVPVVRRRAGARRSRGQGPREVVGPRRAQLLALAREYGARDLRIFGSVARGEATAGSDVDLLVRFDDPPPILAKLEFEERVERLLGRRVDLATEENLHWMVRPQAVAEAVPV